MKESVKKLIRRIADTRFSVVFYVIYQIAILFVYTFLKITWAIKGKKKPDTQAVQMMRENVTFIFKTFERPKLAKKLYRNIQSYYPGVKVIIADDSEKPLDIVDKDLEIIRLPFNSGLSFGLNRALDKVETPYVIRMDDDELLTPYTRFHEHLDFLMGHPEVDLVGVLPFNLPSWTNLKKEAQKYYEQPMGNAPKKLKIAHMTQIDERRKVVAKPPNIFIARTDKIREVGYDDNIRMIDHNEFFYRAAGNIVSVLDESCYAAHYHNRYNRHYQSYRSDISEDIEYIRNKVGNKSTHKRFLEALSATLKKETVSWEKLSSAEWKSLFKLAEHQQVLPLVFEAVCNCPAVAGNENIINSYRQSVFRQTAMQVVKTDEFLVLYQQLCEAGVQPLVVKGLICRQHYLLPNHRISKDEDLLIQPEQFERVHRVMLQNGMRVQEMDEEIDVAYEVPYVKEGKYLYVEVHKQLFPTQAEAYGGYNCFFENAHEKAIKEVIKGVEIYTMCHTDHLLYLICHAFKHFLHSGIGVRQVCDIVLFANAHGSEIDWKYIVGRCKEMRAEKIVAAMFQMGRKYFGFEADKAGYPRELAEIEVDESALLKDMLEGGILGNLGASRVHSSNITLNAVTADKKGEKVKGSVWKTVFPPVSQMVRRFSYLEKHPYLLPIAWISRIIIYGQEIKKSKNNNPSKSVEIGNRRVEMLKEYGVIKEK